MSEQFFSPLGPPGASLESLSDAGPERVEREETSTLISCDKVDGTAVFDCAGHRLGTIETLMIDKVSGMVRYAVLSCGGILGFGSQHYPLRWGQLRYDVGLGGYVVSLTEQQVQDSVACKAAVAAAADREWGERAGDRYQGPLVATSRAGF
jgi:hypothetical protein